MVPFSSEDEKDKFCKTAAISAGTYATDALIAYRTRRIFGTFARTLAGRGRLPEDAKEAEMANLVRVVNREVIRPLLSSAASIARSQGQFDEWHRMTVESMVATCPISWEHGPSLTVGMAQKLVNLHSKDLWALDLVPESCSRVFHPIIDKVTLEHLLKLPGSYAWTRLDSYEEYMWLQSRIRERARRSNSYPLALECRNWNENRKKG